MHIPRPFRARLPLVAAASISIMFGFAGGVRYASAQPALLPTDPVPKGESGPRELKPLLEAIRAKHKLPGMVGAVLEGNEIIAIGACGFRVADGDDAVTIHDKFHIGSCTKAMTATLVAMLVEDGTMTWGTTVWDVFSDVQMDEGWKQVKVEQLLTNCGGGAANLDRDNLWSRLWSHKGSARDARRKLVEGVLKHPPEAAPGEKFIYSNAGFAIAGAMAEKLTDKAWEDLMRARLFGPLGMKSAGFGAPGRVGAVDEPRGHQANGTPVDPGPGGDNPPAIGPAGTVHCTIGDWGKFIALHLRGDQGDAKLLKAESFKKLHTPGPAKESSYAMGWGISERPWAGASGRVLTHAGSNTMWFAVVWIAPDRNQAFIACCNQGGDKAAKACDEAVAEMIKTTGQSN